MRAIDADELEELFREVIADIAKKPEINGAMEHMVRASAMVVEMIHDVPTIEPYAQPEQRKGEWIPEFDGKFTGGAYWFSCSKCKRIVTEVRNGGWNFCPNCGARMER